MRAALPNITLIIINDINSITLYFMFDFLILKVVLVQPANFIFLMLGSNVTQITNYCYKITFPVTL